jgi:hypothetical protein
MIEYSLPFGSNGEVAIQRSNRRLVLVISGFTGVVMGLYSQTLTGFGQAAMWFRILLWYVANAGSGTT